MKRNGIMWLLVLMFIVFGLLAGCSTQKETDSDALKKIDSKAKEKIVMASWPVEWGSYAISVGQADIISKNTNLDVVIESTPGAIIEAVSTGKAMLGAGDSIVNLSNAFNALERYADKPWAPAKNLRVLINSEVWRYAFLTLPKTGVKTLPDLKGKAIGWYSYYPSMPQYQAILEAHGLDLEKDVKVREVGDANWRELQMGRLQLAWDVLNAELLEMQQDVGDIVFLPVDKNKFDLAKNKDPITFAGVSLGKMSYGDIPGLNIPDQVDTVDFQTVLFANDKLSEEAAYTIVKTLVENYKQVQALAFGMKDFSPETAAPVVSTVPFHPGAVKAYKELGLWTKEHEEAQADFK